jgi:NADP-dependent 3-hydroxy acid dehydrogenase YdfG
MEPEMMLKDKVAVIYGAAGAIGSAVARAFASEGANLFLTEHHLAPVEAVAKDLTSARGSADAEEVDALDEQAVDEHLQFVTEKAGRRWPPWKHSLEVYPPSSHLRAFA